MKHRGFTLLELMVVVAIVTILMALLVPFVGRARTAAMTKKCLSNMRQLGISITVAQSDSGGAFPCVSYDDFRTGRGQPGEVTLIEIMRPYLPAGMIKLDNGQEWIDENYTCPLYRTQNNEYGDFDGFGFGAYAYRHVFKGNNERPPRPDNWPDDLAGRHASLLQGDLAQNNPSRVERWMPATYGIIWDNGWINTPVRTVPHDYYGIPGHHPDYNVLFADLHAATHPWVHNWGVLAGNVPPVPREYRNDLPDVE